MPFCAAVCGHFYEGRTLPAQKRVTLKTAVEEVDRSHYVGLGWPHNESGYFMSRPESVDVAREVMLAA